MLSMLYDRRTGTVFWGAGICTGVLKLCCDWLFAQSRLRIRLFDWITNVRWSGNEIVNIWDCVMSSTSVIIWVTWLWLGSDCARADIVELSAFTICVSRCVIENTYTCAPAYFSTCTPAYFSTCSIGGAGLVRRVGFRACSSLDIVCNKTITYFNHLHSKRISSEVAWLGLMSDGSRAWESG